MEVWEAVNSGIFEILDGILGVLSIGCLSPTGLFQRRCGTEPHLSRHYIISPLGTGPLLLPLIQHDLACGVPPSRSQWGNDVMTGEV